MFEGWGHSGVCEKGCSCDRHFYEGLTQKKRIYKCKICSRKYGLKHGLETHLAIENKIPRFHKKV